MSAPSCCTIDTEYSACSTEFAPHDSSLLVCGTYQIVRDEDAVVLDEASPPTKRLGRCLVYQVDNHAQLQEKQRVEMSAILDMKWCHQPPHTLALATSTGVVSLQKLDSSDEADPHLLPVQDVQVANKDKLCLSLDWNNRLFASLPPELVVSISDGTCATLGVRNGSYGIIESWAAHDFEPWIASFDYWTPDCIWTGGDDCKLKIWDRRRGFADPVATNKRFDGGVTTISHHHLTKYLVAVGSYDAKLRLFDKRSIARPLAEHDVGGGVWRTRWHPTQPSRLLVACMHDGFNVVDLQDNSTFSTSLYLAEHESLAYGADWTVKPNGETVAATCSFYDHQLKTWQV